MEHNYKLLGLSPNASEAQVDLQYEKLKRNYNPDNFTDAAQKKHAEKSMAEITAAYNRIKASLNKTSQGFSGGATRTATAYQGERIEHVDAEIVDSEEKYTDNDIDRRRFYDYVRRMIQNGEYDTAMSRLNSYANINDAEWQFLMGSAMYYNGFVSDSYPHFRRAAELAPHNREYSAMFGRMNQSRKGNVYSSTINKKDLDDMNEMCDDACDLLKCLICINCLRR